MDTLKIRMYVKEPRCETNVHRGHEQVSNLTFSLKALQTCTVHCSVQRLGLGSWTPFREWKLLSLSIFSKIDHHEERFTNHLPDSSFGAVGGGVVTSTGGATQISGTGIAIWDPSQGKGQTPAASLSQNLEVALRRHRVA